MRRNGNRHRFYRLVMAILVLALIAAVVAAVMTGAEAMSRATGVPVFLSDVIQGTALLAMLVALLFTAYRIRRVGAAR